MRLGLLRLRLRVGLELRLGLTKARENRKRRPSWLLAYSARKSRG